MFSLFLNPYTMIAGAALVSSPIVIHLINRLRYRRVKWAAMEFLLKSQKRNRRRLIIEQLILLALRCLLVLLIGLLLARFISDALALTQPQSTQHVVVLDDTASMGDAWRQDGQPRVTFDVAKKAIVEDIAGGASQAQSGTAQSLAVVRLSALDAPIKVDRLNRDNVADLERDLADLKSTALHIDLIDGVRRARELFEEQPAAKHVLHLVSDFRQRDWSGGSAEALNQVFSAMTQTKGAGGVQVHLMDVADPVRSPTQRAAIDHGNLGVVDVQPEARVAPRNMSVEFALTVANYSPAERKNVRVTIKVNGEERPASSMTILSVPPGETQKTFLATFQQLGWNQVTASLEAEEAGLAIDNTRYVAVEVRDKVPMLFVEGDPSRRGKLDSDSFFLRALFLDAAKGYDVVQRGPQELEQPNLDQYPTIYLLNVPRLSDKAKASLEAYVKNGGGVCFCLGDQVNPDYYNQSLYADGRGLFPAPIDRPTPALTDEQKAARIFDPALPPKVFPRGDTHPVLARLYREDKTHEANTYLKFLLIDRYFPVPRARWNVAPGTAEELFTLPNYRALDDYAAEAQRLINQLPTENPKYQKYATLLKNHQRRVKEVLGTGKQLYQLANAIESLLTDTSDPKDPQKPNLREFWQLPENADLNEKFARLLESVRYGDPLLVGKRYGKGRVLAYLTTAGSAWNDFPNGPGRPYYVMLMLEMQKYLASTGTDVNRVVGSPLEIVLDAGRYANRMRRFFVPEADMPAGDDAPKAANAIDLREQVGVVQGSRLSFLFSEARKPGVYRFELTPQTEGASAAPARTEQISYAFNVDTAAEGNLQRATRDDIESTAPGARLHSPGSGLADILKERRSDLSESPWLFLLLLLVLIAEQAMAVRLSYHLSGAEMSTAVNLGTRTVS
jgi:Aerotolerance regulator N-terminal